MQSIGDILQAIAQQRRRGGPLPLIMLRSVDPTPGERISHLPVEGELAQAWMAFTGEPFRPHQAQALTALRRGDPVALRATSAAVINSGLLLVYAIAGYEPSATTMLLVSDEVEAWSLHARIGQINDALPLPLRLTPTLFTPTRRPDPFARMMIVTPEALHGRLLRHHERAWAPFWAQLRLIGLPDIHRYTGVAAAHLADLLLRTQRVAIHHAAAQPLLFGTLLDLAAAETTLNGLLGQPWRIIPADDDAQPGTMLAVWQAGSGRMREATEIALALQRQGYAVHIACGSLERAAIVPSLGDVPGITVGPGAPSAQVLLTVGYPGSHSAVRRLLRSGYQAVMIILGDLPHEQALAHRTETLLSGPATAWVPPPPNAYVTALHVVCAASELPLTEAEVDSWGAREIVDRLVAHQQLVDLPDPEVAWKPAHAAGDPYLEFNMLASSGAAIYARTEQGQSLGSFDPTGFERWTYQGAALPAGAGGMRVIARDEESGSITLRIENGGRRTYPLRRCSIEVRETRDERMLHGRRRVGFGRVVANEEISGYREATPSAGPAEQVLQPSLRARWIAPACWFELPTALQVGHQLIGWSLAAAVALSTSADHTDVVPCYDAATRRIYLVDAQPGGSGIAAWVFANAEELLPLAYDVALACRGDTFLEPLSRADQDWLLTLLGRSDVRLTTSAEAPLRPSPPVERAEPVRHTPPAEPPLPAAPLRRGEPALSPRQEPLPPRSEPPAAADEPIPDPTALIERLRRQREQRERAQASPNRAAAALQTGAAGIEPRFAAGDRIFCLPYGDGVVQLSRIEADRELLVVTFPQHGELTIDPAVSLVRKLDHDPEPDDVL